SLGARAALAAGVGVFLVAPAAWAETTLEAPVNGVFPGAGPSFVSGLAGDGLGRFGGFRPRFGNGPPPAFSADSQALAYAKTHGATARFPLIVSGATSAAGAIIDGDRVSAIGGFSGRETSESAAFVARLVRDGDARYFLLGEGFGFRR